MDQGNSNSQITQITQITFLLSHHHSTSALVSEILMSVLQTVQKNNRQFTYGQTVQKTTNNLHMDRWWNPKFRNAATETVKRCVTCQKNNDVPAAITPAAHTPAPPGPFRHLQVDYISLPPCKGKTDALVVIDKFSRWVEAYPTGHATAAHTAKCLVTDFIPRWGLPDCIDCILLLFLLLAYYLCIRSIKCFLQQMTPASHEEMTVPIRRDYYP